MDRLAVHADRALLGAVLLDPAGQQGALDLVEPDDMYRPWHGQRGSTATPPAWGEDWVSARPPTSAEAREFGIKRGSPVTVVHSLRFAADDTVIEYAELISRADTRVTYRYKYSPVETA